MPQQSLQLVDESGKPLGASAPPSIPGGLNLQLVDESGKPLGASAPPSIPGGLNLVDESGKALTPDVSVNLDYGAPADPSSRTATEVMQDQAANVLKGIPQAITGIPGFLEKVTRIAATGNAMEALQFVKDTLHPLVTTVKGGMSLLAEPGFPARNFPEGNPDNPAWKEAAGAAGANLGGIALGEVAPIVGEGLKSAGKAGVRAMLGSSEELQAAATTNKARALAPTTLQGKADAASIAEELSQKGTPGGLRAKKIDSNIMADLKTNGERVQMAENRLTGDAGKVTGKFTEKQSLVQEIDAAKAKLKIPRTGVTASPEAVAQLDDIRGMINQLPDYIDADQLIELRRQLDKRAEDAGAFGVNGDSLKAELNRGVANIVRGKLNGLDADLKAANHDYSVSRKAGDIVERRQLGESGKIAPAVSSHGGILDDILFTWAGEAMGGAPGGAVAEAINLASQSRGFANIKSAIYQKLADLTKTQMGNTAKYTGPAGRELPRDASGQIIMPATEDALLPGTSQKNPRFEAPANQVADKIERDPVTGEILMPRDTPRRMGNLVIYKGKTYMDTKLPPEIKGLLEQGVPLPPPADASFVRATSAGSPTRALLGPENVRVIAMPIEGPTGPKGGYPLRAPTRGLISNEASPTAGMPGAKQLPPHRGAIVTPAPADISHLKVVDAAKRIAVDPNTGILYQYWTTEAN